MTVQIRWIDSDSSNGMTFPEFMYCRIQALHITIPKYTDNPELGHLLKYRSWSRDEIAAHFLNVEYQCNQHIILTSKGYLDTLYTNDDCFFYLQFLYKVAEHSTHEQVYTQIKGHEYGVFSWAEKSISSSPGGVGGQKNMHRVTYTWEDRPKLNGKIVRRMYQGADYVCAGRALQVGLIEQKINKKVIWLSIDEHDQVLHYLRGKRK